MTADEIIAMLELQPLPVEGGLFKRSYCSDENLQPAGLPRRYRSARPASTAIYYLLTADPGSFSALHKLLSDEIYHFYLGDPVELLVVDNAGELQRTVLGQDLLAGQQVQQVVPRDSWQASRLMAGGRYALLGTTMAPGYDSADYIHADADTVMRICPDHSATLLQLLR
jgi:uncharacterized protein